MGATPESELARANEAWREQGLERALDDDAPVGRADFTSNDYLGLSRHPEVLAAARAALDEHGAGARAARLLGGGSPAHAAAERAAAEWLDADTALLFPSGWQANLGLVGTLVGRGDVVLSDERNHASLIDGARLSRARVHVYRHLDVDALERALATTATAGRRLVVTESIFSMDGDRAPLAAIHDACERHDAWLVVDEAHAVGLLGPRGAGAAAEEGLSRSPRLAARVVTGGKALGVGGAFVASGRETRQRLIDRARSFVFTTAPPPVVAGALERAIALLAGADEARARCLASARGLARALGLAEPAAGIVPLVVGSTDDATQAARELRDAGFDVRAVRPPTVPEGTSRLRIVVHASNTESELDELARRLRDVPRVAPPDEAPDQAHPLIVVGTDTGIGKTVVSALLLRAARRAGAAAYWKPVQTGDDDDSATVRELAGADAHEVLRPAWSLPLPASPHEAAAAAGVEIDPSRISGGLVGLQRTLRGSRIVVELAGGLLVPYRGAETQADWLARARVPVVLVARSGLGTLNHTLLTLEALRARHVEPRALFLVGEPHDSNRETLRELGSFAHVYEVPPFEPLDGEALDRWIDAHDLEPVLRP